MFRQVFAIQAIIAALAAMILIVSIMASRFRFAIRGTKLNPTLLSVFLVADAVFVMVLTILIYFDNIAHHVPLALYWPDAALMVTGILFGVVLWLTSKYVVNRR